MLEPSLSTCIETTARREYERVLSRLLRGKEEDQQMGEELELLRVFLEAADFSRLRSLSESLLVAGKRVKFILRSKDTAPGYAIEMKAAGTGEEPWI